MRYWLVKHLLVFFRQLSTSNRWPGAGCLCSFPPAVSASLEAAFLTGRPFLQAPYLAENVSAPSASSATRYPAPTIVARPGITVFLLCGLPGFPLHKVVVSNYNFKQLISRVNETFLL